ncbi:MAG: nucleoside triphosphate pyrophosphohydrolase [Porticoccaceae bacterium]|nr:MAG: nucleoside triphosphate pyrophosphohydrolase [Porticoccaceae bacterium]
MTERNQQSLSSLDDLLYLMQRLRDPITGCPWDVKQTFKTIVPYTLEEVYEVVDTIEREDYPHLREELGDLLFQVVFYSELADEQTLFNFNDVVSTVVKKLVARHPHVFPEGTLGSMRQPGQLPEEAGIKKTWESIKKSERAEKGHYSVLSDIPASLPALTRAQKLQKRAANVGFDWPSIDGVLNKLAEETNELNEAINQDDQGGIEEELGDLMFTVVNMCRHFGLDAEMVLRKSSRKFEYRFQYIEKQVKAKDLVLSEMSLDELDRLWDEAKQR